MMRLIFGLDIGTTSIGFAVINHDPDRSTGGILHEGAGARIFPEARDPKGTPLNQERRSARLRRRQLRRRRDRRRLLGDLLCKAGLLPARNSPEWGKIIKGDPYALRKRAFRRRLGHGWRNAARMSASAGCLRHAITSRRNG